VESVREHIQHLFSSPSLVLQSWFCEELVDDDTKFCPDLALYLQKQAFLRLKKWDTLAEPKSNSFKNLQMTERVETYSLHTAYPVKIPLKQNKFVFHWALVFEGPHRLLRIEYCQENKIEWTLLEKTADERRAFWFRRNWFTQRWIKLWPPFQAKHQNDTLYVSTIGFWLEDWYQHHRKYTTLKNNCQHFVRDIVARFNRDIAVDLSALMDANTATIIIPALTMAHGLDQFTRTENEAKRGRKAIHSSKKEVKSETKIEPPDDNSGQINSNLDAFYKVIAEKDVAKTIGKAKML